MPGNASDDLHKLPDFRLGEILPAQHVLGGRMTSTFLSCVVNKNIGRSDLLNLTKNTMITSWKQILHLTDKPLR